MDIRALHIGPMCFLKDIRIVLREGTSQEPGMWVF